MDGINEIQGKTIVDSLLEELHTMENIAKNSYNKLNQNEEELLKALVADLKTVNNRLNKYQEQLLSPLEWCIKQGMI